MSPARPFPWISWIDERSLDSVYNESNPSFSRNELFIHIHRNYNSKSLSLIDSEITWRCIKRRPQLDYTKFYNFCIVCSWYTFWRVLSSILGAGLLNPLFLTLVFTRKVRRLGLSVFPSSSLWYALGLVFLVIVFLTKFSWRLFATKLVRDVSWVNTAGIRQFRLFCNWTSSPFAQWLLS